MGRKKKVVEEKVKAPVEQYSFKVTFTENSKHNPLTRSVVVSSKDFNAAIKLFYQQFKNVSVNQIEAVGKPAEEKVAEKVAEEVPVEPVIIE